MREVCITYHGQGPFWIDQPRILRMIRAGSVPLNGNNGRGAFSFGWLTKCGADAADCGIGTKEFVLPSSRPEEFGTPV